MTFLSLTSYGDIPATLDFHLDFSPITWPLYRAWPSPNHEWVPWSIGNGFCMPAGNAHPFGHLVPSPFLGTCLCSNCWDEFSQTYHVFSRIFTLNAPWYSRFCSFYILVKIANYPLLYWWMNSSNFRSIQRLKEWPWHRQFVKSLILALLSFSLIIRIPYYV